jgi:hypothetical protein
MSWTRVAVSIYRPEGFEDTFFVTTEDRGKAVKLVLESFTPEQLQFVNYVTARSCEPVPLTGNQGHIIIVEGT